MEKPKKPADEDRRLEALRRLGVLDTPPEERFDRLTRLAQNLLSVPTAVVSLVDAERQWFKSRQGLDLRETPRDVSFCGHAILGAGPFLIADAAKDSRFADNPLVVSAPNIRFYAGVPLTLSTGETVGTLCVLDRIARTLDARRVQLLRDLAALAVNELEGATAEFARAAVRDREAEFRSFLDETTDLVLNADLQGRLLDANAAALKALGRSPRDAAGALFLDLVAPESRERCASMLSRVMKGEESGDVDAAFPSKSGARVLARGRARVQRENGRPARIRLVFRDVTARARAAERLAVRRAAAKERRRRAVQALTGSTKDLLDLRAALDASAIVVTTDAGGRILSVNDGFVALSGYPRETITGKTHRLVRSGKHAEGFFKEMWETILSGRIWRGEICNRARNGDPYWVHTTIVPFLDESGKPFQFVAISRDLTGLKRAEARAAEAAARLQAVLDAASQVAIIAADPSGRVTVFNKGAEALSGYPASEMLGRPAAPLHPGDGGFDALTEAARQGGPSSGECSCLRKDGSSVPVRLTVTALRGPGGEVGGFLAVAADITQSRLAGEELAKARDAAVDLGDAKARFLSHMSHEVRAPMNALLGMAGLLLDAGLTPPQRELAEGLRDAGESLTATLGDILDLSRLEAGAVPLEESDFAPRLLAEDAALLHAARAREKGLELAVFVDESLPPLLRADADRLRQILGAFVDNAVKFTERGEVVVSARRASEEGGCVRLRFEVQDAGAGIDPAAQAKLFTAFTRAGAAASGAGGGAGLGLAISRKLADMMKGAVGVVSAPGKGSTFWFEAPVRKLDAAPPPGAPELAGVRVLVVDGAEAGRRVTASLAASWGMRPHAAADGAAALAALRAAEAEGNPFILALIDARLPDMDGAQLAQEIKGDPALVAVRMIMTDKPVFKAPLQDAVCAALGVPPSTQALARKALSAEPLAYWRELRLLVADDNAVSRKAALLRLRSLGCKADAVADGREAAAAAAAIPYDLILMDCRMPGMDGFEATAAIRARPAAAGRKLVIVAMSADALAGDRERCLAAGMDDAIVKPVRVEDLAAAIGRWFGSVDPAALQGLRELRDDAAVREIIEAFAKDAEGRLSGLSEAARAGDAAALETLARALKGGAATLGAKGVERLALRLEVLGGEKRLEEAEGLVESLRRELGSAVKLLRAGAIRK